MPLSLAPVEQDHLGGVAPSGRGEHSGELGIGLRAEGAISGQPIRPLRRRARTNIDTPLAAHPAELIRSL